MSALMFMGYFIWGAWYVTMGTYLISKLKANATEVGSAYANFSIAAIISPVLIGFIADRLFSARKILGLFYISGGIVLYLVSMMQSFDSFWWLMLLYTLLYLPTLSLANSICLSQMKNPDKEFPSIRVFGTIGWIVAGLLVGFLQISESSLTFKISAISSVCLGLFCLSLPVAGISNKPTEKCFRQIFNTRVLDLFKERSFNIFFLASVVICIPLAFYYSFANHFLNDSGVHNATALMTLGQISEIICMLAIPFVFRKMGIKVIMLVALFAWVSRYLLFSFGDSGSGMWMLTLGIVLHGICYDFFFVSGQIYIDKKAVGPAKHAAQSLITFATIGVGNMIGSYLAGIVIDRFTLQELNGLTYQWRIVWMIPAGIALGTLFVFAFLFRVKEA